jgi:hypothetical protein
LQKRKTSSFIAIEAWNLVLASNPHLSPQAALVQSEKWRVFRIARNFCSRETLLLFLCQLESVVQSFDLQLI